MKNWFLPLILACYGLFTFSCSSFLKRNLPPVQTVQSDMFPQNISRTEYYTNLGIGYSEDGDTLQASEYFRLAILHDPQNIDARVNLVNEYFKQEANFLAQGQLQEILKITPNHTWALHKLGELYLRTKIYQEAIVVYSKLLEVSASDAKAAWALYFIEKDLGHLNQASDKLFAVEKITGPELSVDLEKAELFGLQKQWPEQKEFLGNLYNKNPNQPSVVKAYSDNLFQLGLWQDAFTALQRFSDTNSFDFEVSEKLAYASVRLQNWDVALEEYSKQKKYNAFAVVDLKMAHVYFLQENYGLAEELYLSSLKQKDDDETKYYLSKIYQLTNRFDQSVQYLKQIPSQSQFFSVAQIEMANIEKPSNFKQALNRLAEAYSERPDLQDLSKAYIDMLLADHQFNAAILILEDSIIKSPNDEDLRLKIAYAFYQVNEKRGFEQQMSEAIKINPNNSEIYSVLAQLWFVKSKKASEVEFFARKALDLKSKNLNLKPLLAWALLDQNKSAEAIALFEESYEQNPDEYFYAKSLAEVYEYAYITSKAEQFAKIALALHSTYSLNSVMQNKATHKLHDFDTDPNIQSRLPASLESY